MFYPSFIIREEPLYGRKYWMIYRTWLCFEVFIETCNTPESAALRVKEMENER